MAGCVPGVEVTDVLLAAAVGAAGRNATSISERTRMMATNKTTTRKTTTKKAAPAKKGSGKAAGKPVAKKAAAKKDRKMSALDAAAKVLAEAKKPMRTREMIEAMAAKGYWKSPGGQTPHATLYSAILREINTKGKEARFKKTDRGLFAKNG